MPEKKDMILTNIMTILTGSSLDESFVEMVLKRLENLSYVIDVNDGWMIAFSIQKVENHIMNSCNTNSIPEGLKFTATDMVCGEFLFALKQIGKLDEVFNLETALKSVQMGDTTINFTDSSQSPEQKLNSLLSYLTTKGEGDFVCYRKIKW